MMGPPPDALKPRKNGLSVLKVAGPLNVAAGLRKPPSSPIIRRQGSPRQTQPSIRTTEARIYSGADRNESDAAVGRSS